MVLSCLATEACRKALHTQRGKLPEIPISIRRKLAVDADFNSPRNIGISERKIAVSCSVSRNTVSEVCKKANEIGVKWPLSASMTDKDLEKVLFPNKGEFNSGKRMPDFDYCRKELLKNGVTKKLLWTEYLEACKQANEEPLMYSQFCHALQKHEEKRRARKSSPD